MSRPPLEVADLLRTAGAAFLERNRHWLSWKHVQVLRAIARCRTAALGGHLDECTRCGYRAISYHSCRDRHCPKCQTAARERWIAARRRELLPTRYLHVVFTLPRYLAPVVLQNKKVIYDLLFRASAETLLEVARDPRRLGAEIGFFSVLHTWNQKVRLHPHVHCVVPAGGLSLDHTRWVHSPDNYFLPKAVLRKVFRGKFVAALRRPRICATISRPLHPSRGHLQTSPRLHCRWPSDFSLARFRSPQRTQAHRFVTRQILASLPAAYSSERLRAYPALLFPGLPTAPHDIAPMLPVVGCGTRSAYRRTRFFHRRRSRSLSLSQVWRTNEGHRTAHCRRNPTSFSTTDQLCGMKLLSPTPTLRALLRATPLFAWSENKFLLAAYSTTVFTTRFHRSHFLGPRCAIKCAKENNPLTEAQTWRLNPSVWTPLRCLSSLRSSCASAISQSPA